MAEVNTEDYVKLTSEIFGADIQKPESPKVLQPEDIIDIFKKN